MSEDEMLKLSVAECLAYSFLIYIPLVLERGEKSPLLLALAILCVFCLVGIFMIFNLPAVESVDTLFVRLYDLGIMFCCFSLPMYAFVFFAAGTLRLEKILLLGVGFLIFLSAARWIYERRRAAARLKDGATDRWN